MCLDNISKLKTAEKNIVCYKVLITPFSRNLPNEFQSPFQYTKYEMGFHQRANYFLTDRKRMVIYGIHCFKTKYGAEALRKSFIEAEWFKKEDIHIFKFCIEKGTKYYEGTFDVDGKLYKSFAAERVAFPKQDYSNSDSIES